MLPEVLLAERVLEDEDHGQSASEDENVNDREQQAANAMVILHAALVNHSSDESKGENSRKGFWLEARLADPSRFEGNRPTMEICMRTRMVDHV